MLLRYCHFLLLLLLLLLEKYNIAIVLRMCLTQAMNYFCAYTRMCCYYLGGGGRELPELLQCLDEAFPTYSWNHACRDTRTQILNY